MTDFVDSDSNADRMRIWSERMLRSNQLPAQGNIILNIPVLGKLKLDMGNKEDRLNAMFFMSWPWL